MPIWQDNTVPNANMPDREKAIRDEATNVGAISSVFGRSGTISAAQNDYSAALIDAHGSVPVFNVVSYGAKGDGTTDDSTAIQNAINDAVTANGGAVYFPIPSTAYYLATGLSCTGGGIALIADGRSGQSTSLGQAGCRIRVGTGQVGFTYNPSSLQFKAPVLCGLHFVDKTPGSGAGGVLIEQAVGAKIIDCYASDFTAGYGFSFSPSVVGAQYSTLINPIVSNCKIGVTVTKTNGVEIFGGLIDQNNAGSVTTGSTGIQLVSGDTFRAFGTRIQYCDTGVDQQSGASGADYYGLRVEGCNKLVQIAGNNSGVWGGAFSNSVIGGTGTAFTIVTGATSNVLQPTHIVGVATSLSDSGTSTITGTGLITKMPGLPTVDPHVVGQVWSNTGVLTVSAG